MGSVHAELREHIEKTETTLLTEIRVNVRAELLERIDTVRTELLERIDTVRAELLVRAETVRAELLERIEKTETALLTEFHKWASPVEMRQRSHAAAMRLMQNWKP